MERPKELEKFNFKPVVAACQEYLSTIEFGGPGDDEKQFIFEAVLEALYGKDIWKYVNTVAQ